MAHTEYAIWGKPPGDEFETLLVGMLDGKPITDRETAERLVTRLTDEFNATDVRIQDIDFSDDAAANLADQFRNAVK